MTYDPKALACNFMVFFRRKCIFSPYILHFFHFGFYILFLPLLVSKLINANI